MNRLTGIDVSTYQKSIDWHAVKGSGRVAFAYAKATEGTGYADDTFRANHDGAKAAGVPFGAYHFFRFGEDAAAQAAHFLSTIDGYSGQLLPMVDVETNDGTSTLAYKIEQLGAFNAAVEKVVGKRIVVYTSYGFWQYSMGGTDAFSGHPLWIAEYNTDATPTLPSGWNDWALWQFSSSETVPGIAGPVDVDRLHGADLRVIEV